MDLNNNKRALLGVLIITVIFGFFALMSTFKLFTENNFNNNIAKSDYLLVLEKELNIKFNEDNIFDNLAKIDPNIEVVIVPTKYQYYYKPCFDFVILTDGIKITNRRSKEFDDYNFKVGMKITKINNEELLGKDYFEILDLIYTNELNKEKIFTIENHGEITYKYTALNDRLYYNADTNILSIYNLDELTLKTYHKYYKDNPNLIIDLSNATVNTLEGISTFVSLYSTEKEILFKTPENIKGQKYIKFSSNIILGDNTDEGILFALTNIVKLNKNVLVAKNLEDLNNNNTINNNLITTKFYSLKELKSTNHIIYIKNVILEAKSDNSGGTVL